MTGRDASGLREVIALAHAGSVLEVSEAEAATIRAVFEQRGEFAAVIILMIDIFPSGVFSIRRCAS
jgi:hypothetical protein